MEGYKVFNNGLINRYGKKFELGETYTIDISRQEIKYGNNGYGFHFVKQLEDGLRFFDGMNKKIEIVKVNSLGQLKEYRDDYYEYYDLYVTDKIKLEHILTRKEIIDYILNTTPERAERFIQGYKLTKEELELIKICFKNKNLNNAIEYYQNDNKDIYTKQLRSKNLYG